MDKNDIDIFSRCTAEFRNSVIVFGEILKLDIEKQSMEAANRERQSHGYSDAYGEDAFVTLSNRMEEIIKRG